MPDSLPPNPAQRDNEGERDDYKPLPSPPIESTQQPGASTTGDLLPLPPPRPVGVRRDLELQLGLFGDVKGVRDESSPSLPAVEGFEILGELGRGGMGVVYKARQMHLGRIVALKMILSGEQADPEERRRFLAEAQVVAAIEHPGIVRVLSFGTHAGSPWFALEYCPGGSLADKLGANALPAGEAARIVAQIARAVHAAHLHGIIHRDLKPGNVLLDAADQPRVADFGLAKRIVGGVTRTGAVMGTPSYMPPEQTRGSKDVGPAADVYALGAILYECLTGRPPFKASTMFETLLQVLDTDPVPPHALAPAVPADLETICLKCLQKESARRYGSASDLADDLDRFLHHEPIRARPVPAWERGVKWARRRPAVAALVIAVVLGLVGAAAGGLFFGLYESQRRQIETQQQQRQQQIGDLLHAGQQEESQGRLALERGKDAQAEEHLTRADRFLTSAVELLADAGPEGLRGQIEEQLREVARDLAELKRRQEMEPRIAQLRGDWRKVLFHEVSPSSHDRIANLTQVCVVAPRALERFGINLDRPPQEAVAALQREQHRLTTTALREVVEMCYEVLLAWAEAEAQMGLLPAKPPAQRIASAQAALRLLDLARALAQTHRLPDSPAYHTRRANYLTQAGRDKDAQEQRRQATALSPSTARDHFLAGLEHYRQGKLELAAEACGLALGKQHNHLWAQYLLALCQVKARRWPEARASLNACLTVQADFLYARLLRGAVHTEWAALLQKRNDLEAAKVFAAAQEDFALALAQASDAKAPDPLGRYAVLTSRSVLWARQKRWNDAVTDLQQAIRLNPAATQAHVNLAEVCRLRGDSRGAIAALTRGIAHSPADAALYHTRARIFLTLKDEASAQRDLKEAIARMPAGDMERLASAYVELGGLKLQQGKPREALLDFDAAVRVQPNHPPAHRQRSRALLQMNEDRKAGQALDRYLASGKATARDYLARGLIHSKLREYAQAVPAYNRVLVLDKDNAEALTQRGWAFVQLEASRPALQDFEAALQLRPKDASSLCGRGHARIQLGQVVEALSDGEEALRLHEDADQELLVACLHARAAVLSRRMATKGRTRAESTHEKRAVELLCNVLERLPQPQRRQFWRERIQPEPMLADLRWHPQVLRARDAGMWRLGRGRSGSALALHPSSVQ